MKDLLIGVDIGGTTIKHGIITKEGTLIEKWEIDTDITNHGENVPYDIWNSIKTRLTDLQIGYDRLIGIGVGAPGFIDPISGVVAIAVNIGWHDFNLKEILENLSNLPVYIDNDANIAALGENWKGSGQLVSNMLAVTLGTGVGGGIIANGQILTGTNGTGAEIGHMTVIPENGYHCNCGRTGCLETIASATGFVRVAKQWIEEGKADSLKVRLQEQGNLSTKDIFEIARSGDESTNQLIEYILDHLGLALANLAVTLNPAKIVIGGGVSKAGEQLSKPLQKSFDKYALPRAKEACEIVIADLGNDAGIFGGAFLALQKS